MNDSKKRPNEFNLSSLDADVISGLFKRSGGGSVTLSASDGEGESISQTATFHSGKLQLDLLDPRVDNLLYQGLKTMSPRARRRQD